MVGIVFGMGVVVGVEIMDLGVFGGGFGNFDVCVVSVNGFMVVGSLIISMLNWDF